MRKPKLTPEEIKLTNEVTLSTLKLALTKSNVAYVTTKSFKLLSGAEPALTPNAWVFKHLDCSYVSVGSGMVAIVRRDTSRKEEE